MRLGGRRRQAPGPSARRATSPRAAMAHPVGRRRGVGRLPLPVPGGGRRGRLSPTRAAALLGLLLALGALDGLATRPVFELTRLEVPDLRWTTRDAVVAAVATPIGTNLFRLQARPIEARLAAIPAVATATVEVSLPDTLVVRIVERQAILAWGVGDRRLLVDREGVVFALGTPASVAAANLPTIADARPSAATLDVGSRLDPIDLDAATRLGSLVPADVDSVATSLQVSITPANGFVLATTPASWVAVFGLYTPSVRTPAMIPGQVRLLRSLLAGREATIDRVFLPAVDSGTFILKPTPRPTSSATP